MQEATLFLLVQFHHHVPISSTTCRSNDVLVEGKRDKDDDGQEIDGGAHGAHALWDLDLVRLAHVATAKAGLHERGAEPADHGVAEGEGEEGEGEGRDEGLAIAGEGVEEDGGRGARDGEEGERLRAGEGRGGDGHGGWMGWRGCWSSFQFRGGWRIMRMKQKKWPIRNNY